MIIEKNTGGCTVPQRKRRPDRCRLQFQFSHSLEALPHRKDFPFCVLQGIMCKIIITEIKYGTGIVDIIEVITG